MISQHLKNRFAHPYFLKKTSSQVIRQGLWVRPKSVSTVIFGEKWNVCNADTAYCLF